MTEAYTTIRYDRSREIGHLTLDRPSKRNAQGPVMWQELVRLGAELLPDETLRCLVVRGEGSTFSAGIDLVEGIAKIQADMNRTPEHADRIAVGMKVAGTFSWARSETSARCGLAPRARGRPAAGPRRPDPLSRVRRLQGGATGDGRTPQSTVAGALDVHGAPVAAPGRGPVFLSASAARRR